MACNKSSACREKYSIFERTYSKKSTSENKIRRYKSNNVSTRCIKGKLQNSDERYQRTILKKGKLSGKSLAQRRREVRAKPKPREQTRKFITLWTEWATWCQPGCSVCGKVLSTGFTRGLQEEYCYETSDDSQAGNYVT